MKTLYQWFVSFAKCFTYKHWMRVLLVLILYAIYKIYILHVPITQNTPLPDIVTNSVLTMVYNDDLNCYFIDDKDFNEEQNADI